MGIVDQLISIYSCMCYEYLDKKKKPLINGAYVYKIAEKYYPGIQNVLLNLKTDEYEKEISDIRKGAEILVNEVLDKERQVEETKKIIDSNTDIHNFTFELNNVISNITAIYDEFSENQIEESYRKIMQSKSSNDKSEKEICKLVIERLQKSTRSKKTKDKINTPDIKHMQDFLGLYSTKP